jgi:putative two-component system response regulator
MTIFALAKLAESRDNETGQHLERVRDYTLALAKQLAGHPALGEEITPTFLRLIYQTTPLHDIGKVAIPDHVLLKPGRLDDREFEIMKSHAQAGADTLALALAEYPQAEFLQMAYDIARAHHERWDGTGYPMGLAGSAIPLAARIFSIADVYDALVSKRVYKEAYTHDVARGIIVSEEGKQFDPDVIAAFRLCEQQFQAISLRGSDEAAEQPHPAESIPA